MELRQFEAALAVARLGTFTAAADALHVAQPALWKRVRDLEAELGVVLFERVGRGVRLTSEGALILVVAEPIVAGSERLRGLARSLVDGIEGEVTIGCLPAHVPRFLAAALGKFAEAHPRMRARLHELDLNPDLASQRPSGASAQLSDALQGGKVDLISSGPVDTGVEGFPIYDVNIVACLPETHALAGSAEIDVSQLAAEPLLLTPSGYLSRNLIDRACAAAGFEPIVQTESHNASTLVALAEHGAGIAVLADDAAPYRGPVETARIVSDDVRLTAEVWLYRSSARTTPAVTAFMDVARRLAQTHR